MSSLADLPELVGFFSYSREDDADDRGKLSALRDCIERELGTQLGLRMKSSPFGRTKRRSLTARSGKSGSRPLSRGRPSLIPIITLRVVKNPYCRFDLDLFLAREAMIGATWSFPSCTSGFQCWSIRKEEDQRQQTEEKRRRVKPGAARHSARIRPQGMRQLPGDGGGSWGRVHHGLARHAQSELAEPADQGLRLARNLALTILPAPSTTRTLEHSNDTSIPA
jgi:hypothetical protein